MEKPVMIKELVYEHIKNLEHRYAMEVLEDAKILYENEQIKLGNYIPLPEERNKHHFIDSQFLTLELSDIETPNGRKQDMSLDGMRLKNIVDYSVQISPEYLEKVIVTLKMRVNFIAKVNED